jgi:hypothetical protein
MQRIILFLLLPLMTNAQMVRFGGNVSGITVSQIQGDTFRVKGNFNDITGVSIGTQLQVGDIFWSPALNAGDTCRRMVVVSADTLFAGFVNFQVNVLGQGSPSTQNSKLMRETPNQSLDYIPQGGNESLRECISQYYSNILDNLLGQGGGLASVLVDSLTIVGDGLTDTLKVDTNVIATIQALNDSLANYLVEIDVDSVTIFGDGVNTPLYADTSVLVTITALNDSLSNITAQVLVDSFTIVGNGLTDSLRVDTNVVVTWSALQDSLGDGMYQETFIADGLINVYQVTLAGGILPDDKSDILVLRNGVVLDAGYIINLDGANGQLELSFMPDVGDEIVIIWFNGDVAVSIGGGGGVDSVFTDGVTVLGNGLLIDKIRVDTTLIATQGYVLDAIQQTGAGDITGVTAGFGISGGGLSGDVTIDVDSNVIATQNYVTGAIAPKLDSVFVDMFLTGNGTQINPLSIDTMYVASKDYVDNSIAGSGLGDITGVNETPQYGIIGGAASGAVLLRVDSTVIADKSWIAAQGYNSGDFVSTGATSGNGISGSATGISSTFTVTSNATNANTPSTIVFRDASGNFSAGTITGTLSGTATQVSSTLTRGTYLTGNNYNGSEATTWAVDATNANTASKVVARDASGNFSAGTITAALTGNASTATTLQNARTINGTSFNGSANITVPVNATNRTTNESGHLLFTGTTATGNIPVYTNTNIRVNPSTSTITATLNGTANQVANSLDAGFGLTGSSYTGSAQRTWVVDTVNIASKSWVSGQIGGGGVTATNGSINKLAFFTNATNIDGGSRWRLGTQSDPVLTNSTDVFYYGNAGLTDKFSVFGKTYLEDATIATLAATNFSVTNFGVSALTVSNNATFNGTVGNSIFNPGGQLGIQTNPSTNNESLTARFGAAFNVTNNSTSAGNFSVRSRDINNMLFMNSNSNAMVIGGGTPDVNGQFQLKIQKGLYVNESRSTASAFNGLLVSGGTDIYMLFANPQTNSVGINQFNTASFVKLDVNGSQRIFDNSLVFQNSSTGASSITAGTRLSLSAGTTNFNINNQNSGAINIYTGGNVSQGLTIAATTGNVTVGGGSGIGKLNVNGDVDIAAGSVYRINGVAIGTTTINNNAANRIITGSGTANTLNGQANLTYSNGTLTNSLVNNSAAIINGSLNIIYDEGLLNGTTSFINFGQGPMYFSTNNINAISILNNGQIQFPTYSAGTLVTNASGVITAQGSDGRLKNIIKPLESGLDKILRLNPIYYKWKDDSGFNTQFEELGFIAQEIKNVIPIAVPYNEDEVKVLNYSDRAIIATLVKAIQEQQAMIEQLQNEIKELKK